MQCYLRALHVLSRRATNDDHQPRLPAPSSRQSTARRAGIPPRTDSNHLITRTAPRPGRHNRHAVKTIPHKNASPPARAPTTAAAAGLVRTDHDRFDYGPTCYIRCRPIQRLFIVNIITQATTIYIAQQSDNIGRRQSSVKLDKVLK